MTTIAYRDGVLAADTQVTFGAIKGYGRKLHKLNDGSILAFSGSVDDEQAILSYYNGELKKKPHLGKKFEFILIDSTGTPFYCINDFCQIPIEDRWHACGEGWQIAIAAMHIGLSAKDAVEVAGDLNPNTNKYIDTYTIRTKKLVKSVWPHETKK